MQNNSALQQESLVKNDRKLIDGLRKSKVYRQYERVFSEATGLPLALSPMESFGLPFHGNKNENPFCALLADRKSACGTCLRMQEKISKNQAQQPCTARCSFGLTETRVPIQLGDRVIGFLQVGQVFTHAPETGVFKKAVRQVQSLDSAGEKKLFGLWKNTPVVPLEKYNATVQLLRFFAKQLSALSNQITIEEANAESPVITRARQFIAAHKTEVLSLGAVAKAAGASVFHFCKIFHKSTGLNFTEYVARARVEDAKQGLLNRNRRISEIAYDVGFQSLTQFNRTFKRMFGQSPSEYRERLSGRAALA